MPDRKGQQGPYDALFTPERTVVYGLVAMDTLAGGHRVVHYRLGTPGTRAINKYTWISIVFVYPMLIAVVPADEPEMNRNAFLLWLALIAMTFLHSSAAFWNPAVRHSQEIGRPIFGWMEVPLAFLTAIFAAAFCGPGAGLYLLAALLASLIQIETIRARFKRRVAMQRDAELEAAEFQSFMR